MENNLQLSEPGYFKEQDLKPGQSIINLGPQHPSTHGVLRLEVLLEGEIVLDVVPHIGYLHRCFEKHAEALPYNQIIPYVDRMDYIASMNSSHIYAMAIEKMLGLTDKIPPRIEYIRVLVCELNRLASHFLAIGTFGMDIGAFSPFLWLMRDREHILRMLEWVCGARLLYNFIWIGGLFYDLPIGFEDRCAEFLVYLKPKLIELEQLLINNSIFINRTANVGVLPIGVGLNYGVTGPSLRGSGLAYDLRKVDSYSVYNEIDFDVHIGTGQMGTIGDCWDRNWVRFAECSESVKIIAQCLEKLNGQHKRSRDFDPQALCPKKIRPPQADIYFRGETPRGELGFFIRADGKSDIPQRCKVRSPCFNNLSVIAEISKGAMLADLIANIGSLDLVMGEVDR